MVTRDTGQTVYPVEIRDGEIFVGLEAEPPHERTVTDAMAETMVNWGVKSVFGMVGHSNLGLADALRRRTLDGEMRYYGIRHEGAAAFAASAYGKLTGKPAACLTIAGPGATNLLTGMWDAKVDRAPVLALTGQVQTQVFGPGAFQDIDLTSAFQAVSRFSQTVLPTSNHPELVSLACKSAIVEQDVSHLIFPDDVQTLPSDAKAASPEGRISTPIVRPTDADVDAALALINGAKRPLIVIGHGAWDAKDQIIAMAETLGAPVVTTFKGKGLIPDNHPNAGGVLGALGHADCKLVHERMRSPDRARRVVFEPHRDQSRQAHDPGRLRTDATGQVSSRHPARLGRDWGLLRRSRSARVQGIGRR